jgi:hypothetical protein
MVAKLHYKKGNNHSAFSAPENLATKMLLNHFAAGSYNSNASHYFIRNSADYSAY